MENNLKHYLKKIQNSNGWSERQLHAAFILHGGGTSYASLNYWIVGAMFPSLKNAVLLTSFINEKLGLNLHVDDIWKF